MSQLESLNSNLPNDGRAELPLVLTAEEFLSQQTPAEALAWQMVMMPNLTLPERVTALEMEILQIKQAMVELRQSVLKLASRRNDVT